MQSKQTVTDTYLTLEIDLDSIVDFIVDFKKSVYMILVPLKDRLLWFGADIVKRFYLWHYCWDFNMFYTK